MKIASLICSRKLSDERERDRNMMKKLHLSKVYQLLEPGPVVLLTTSRKGQHNVVAMS